MVDFDFRYKISIISRQHNEDYKFKNILMVVAITVSIIYSVSFLVMGFSLSDRLPYVFNADFTKTNKIKNNEAFQPYYKETNCAELHMKAE